MIEFSQEFVENDVKIAWERIKDLIVNDKLEDVISLDKFGNPRYNLSKKKIDEQAIREQVAIDIDNLGGEEKSIREIWKIFTQININIRQWQFIIVC